MSARLGVRWTIGDVSPRGFDALRFSIWGAWQLFGPQALYAVCVNGVSVKSARASTGLVPDTVEWHAATADDIPAFLRAHLDTRMAEGVGWKFAPVRLFPNLHELSLDNDCVLWRQPHAIARWLDGGQRDALVTAEDVRVSLGAFEPLCRPEPRNSGIRGLPPGLDYADALRQMLEVHPFPMNSELDEQGLQIATLERLGEPLVVTTEEVTICSPFWPHQPHLGRCGAHFVGLNARHLPWDYYGRPADKCQAEHWERHRAETTRRIGLPDAAPS
jgi:hypothetical protein